MRFKVRLYKLCLALISWGAWCVEGLGRKPKGSKLIKNISYGSSRANCYTYDLAVNKQSNESRGVIAFIHGGGFISGDKRLYRKVCLGLAAKGYIVININYPLAPKADLTEIKQACTAAVQHALQGVADVVSPDCRLVFAGDSAGAYIAADLAKDWALPADDRIKTVSCVVGFYGVYDLEAFKNSNFFANDLFLASLFGKNYKKQGLPRVEVAPDFPPMLLVSGERDVLHAAQSVAFENMLKDSGGVVDCKYYDKTIRAARHGFLGYPKNKCAKEAPEIVDKFIRSIV